MHCLDLLEQNNCLPKKPYVLIKPLLSFGDKNLNVFV